MFESCSLFTNSVYRIYVSDNSVLMNILSSETTMSCDIYKQVLRNTQISYFNSDWIMLLKIMLLSILEHVTSF